MAADAESIDLLVGRDTVLRARRAAHRHAEHARHRLHAVVGDCRRVGQGACRCSDAAREAKDYVTGAIAAANRLTIGSGHGPVHHFHRWWEQAEEDDKAIAGSSSMPNITRRSRGRAGQPVFWRLGAPRSPRAQTRRWRMVTSWPRRLPGPGMSAERVAERINALSGGRLQVTVHAAGEVVPAFEVLDAVGSGVAEMGHTASFYWQGKDPSAAFFTTVPFGLTPA